MNIDSITNGIVIDHITAGRGRISKGRIRDGAADRRSAPPGDAKSERESRKRQ